MNWKTTRKKNTHTRKEKQTKNEQTKCKKKKKYEKKNNKNLYEWILKRNVLLLLWVENFSNATLGGNAGWQFVAKRILSVEQRQKTAAIRKCLAFHKQILIDHKQQRSKTVEEL